MPTFIFAGYQRSLVHHVKAALLGGKARLNDWDYALVPGQDAKLAGISPRQISDLLALADKHGGAHIFGIDANKGRDVIEKALAEHFRFRWIPAHLVADVGRGVIDPLLSALEAATTEEAYWRENVMPSDSASPLILPKIFKANRDVSMIWRLSESYNNQGHLQKAAQLIHRFVREHRHRITSGSNTPWLGEDDWIWQDDGPRHGQPEFPEDWKYSLRLPDGFHYDVSPNTKNKTHFTDRHGKQHPLPRKKYYNVTAHGELRGVTRD